MCFCQDILLELIISWFPLDGIEPNFLDRSGQVRSGQARPGQVRSGQARSGQDRPNQVRSGQAKQSQVRSGQIRSGEARPGQARTGQVRSDQVKSGQVRPILKTDSTWSQGHVHTYNVQFRGPFQGHIWTMLGPCLPIFSFSWNSEKF